VQQEIRAVEGRIAGHEERLDDLIGLVTDILERLDKIARDKSTPIVCGVCPGRRGWTALVPSGLYSRLLSSRPRASRWCFQLASRKGIVRFRR
jgi:hypothetical protein